MFDSCSIRTVTIRFVPYVWSAIAAMVTVLLLADGGLAQSSDQRYREALRYGQQYQEYMRALEGTQNSSGYGGHVGVAGPSNLSHLFQTSVRTSQQRALQISLDDCRAAGYQDCKPIASVSNGCIAFAYGLNSGGLVYQTSSDAYDALGQALMYCNEEYDEPCGHEVTYCVSENFHHELYAFEGKIYRDRNFPVRKKSEIQPASWTVDRSDAGYTLYMNTSSFLLAFFCRGEVPVYVIGMKTDAAYEERFRPMMNAADKIEQENKLPVVRLKVKLKSSSLADQDTRWLHFFQSGNASQNRPGDDYNYFLTRADDEISVEKKATKEQFLEVIRNARTAIYVQINPTDPPFATRSNERVSSNIMLAIFGDFSVDGASAAVESFLSSEPTCLN